MVYDAILCEIATPDERDAVSSRGWALGYLGGGLLLAANLALVTAHDAARPATEGQAVRVSLLSRRRCGGGRSRWCPYLGLRDRVRSTPPSSRRLPARRTQPAARRHGGLVRASSRDTLRHLRGYPQHWLFLLAYLFYNDGIQTVIGAVERLRRRRSSACRPSS